ncbi:MAG: hypothetical protein ACXABY_17685 [Candidatus Thorarchaeota archaeon]|jgi:hypothetical protein
MKWYAEVVYKGHDGKWSIFGQEVVEAEDEEKARKAIAYHAAPALEGVNYKITSVVKEEK